MLLDRAPLCGSNLLRDPLEVRVVLFNEIEAPVDPSKFCVNRAEVGLALGAEGVELKTEFRNISLCKRK